PISGGEWDLGARADSPTATETTPVGDYDDEAELIAAFVPENMDTAYTKAEPVRGVDFGNDARPETIREPLTEIPDELVDVVGALVRVGIDRPRRTATTRDNAG
ncbi:MAG: hypothetical protein ABEH58_03460, partial [Haloplanus sp.]